MGKKSLNFENDVKMKMSPMFSTYSLNLGEHTMAMASGSIIW